MLPGHLITSLHKFGGYLFKPVSPKVLIDNKVIKGYTSFKGIVSDDDAPLYIVGFAANRVFRKYETADTLYDNLQPLDDFNVGFPYDSIMPRSFVAIYGDRAFTRTTLRKNKMQFEAMYLKEDTTHLLESLMKVAGVQIAFDKHASERSILQYFEQFSMSECFPKLKALEGTPMDNPVKKKVKRGSLSRKEILELLLNERECAARATKCDRNCAKCSFVRDTDKLLAMYDAVINTYQRYIRQNDGHRLVCMADGSRKWMPKDKAAELLKLPIDRRV